MNIIKYLIVAIDIVNNRARRANNSQRWTHCYPVIVPFQNFVIIGHYVFSVPPLNAFPFTFCSFNDSHFRFLHCYWPILADDKER